MKNKNNTFAGIFPALLTPFTGNGNINEIQLSKLIEFNLEKGVNGFYAGGSTSETFLMTLEERRQLLEITANRSKNNCVLIAHIGCISTDHTVELAKHAEYLGYDAVSAVPPFYYKFGFDQIKKHYFKIADSVRLPVIIYNFPAFSGVNLTLENFGEFLSDERFIGVKYTSGDMFLLEQLRASYPEKLIYNGYDECFLSALAAGADGGIGSTYNFMAEKFINILHFWNAGDIASARVLQREVNEIIAALIKVGVLEGEKTLLNLLGFDFGICRSPFRELTTEDIKLLERTVLPLLK